MENFGVFRRHYDDSAWRDASRRRVIALKFDDDCVYFIFETATLVRTEADQKRQNK